MIVTFSVKKIHGELHNTRTNDSVTLVCLLKNGSYFIDEFIQYYQQIGIHTIIFLDNGSTDNTIEKIKQHKDVVIYSSELPFSRYKVAFKQFLIRKAYQFGWVLVADIDEFFYYPGYEKKKLSTLIRYLDSNKYDVAITHMLDVYPRVFDSQLSRIYFQRDLYIYYNKNDYQALSLQDAYSTACINGDEQGFLNYYIGGTIQRLLNLDRPIRMSKHALFRRHKGGEYLINQHIGTGKVADISCCFLHYRFTGELLDRIDLKRSNSYRMKRGSVYRGLDKIFKENSGSLPLLLPSDTNIIEHGINEMFCASSVRRDNFTL